MDTFSQSPQGVVPVFMGCFMIVIWLVIIVLTAVVFCKIFSKAGYHWALGLIMLIPIGNIIMLLVLAFSEWPIQRQLRAYQQAQMAPPPPGAPHQSFRGV